MILNFVRQFIFGFYSKFSPGKYRVDFPKKAVFITGCDSGLGYNFAVYLNSIGVKVFAGVYSKSSPGAKSLLDKSISVLTIDITNSVSVQNASSHIKESIEGNKYDFFGLINNAGIMIVGEFEWQTEEMMKQQLAVNLLGPMNVIKYFLPLLRQQNGRIVNISSHCAGFPLPGMSVYSAAKAGLRAFSLGLDQELDKFGIRVVDLVPGSFIMHSCILSNQKQYSSLMSDQMTQDVKNTYSDYFDRYATYLSALPVPDPLSKPKIIIDDKLYYKLESAIFSPSPRKTYINEPPRYFIYYSLFSLLPEGTVKNYLVKRFTKMPDWNKSFN